MQHWIDYWDYLDERFWAMTRWFGRELTAKEIGWQPVPAVASIGWNLQHLGEMLDHYLVKVFHTQPRNFVSSPLVTMIDGSQDDGRFADLPAIVAYHQRVRPAYRQFLASLKPEDMGRPLSPRAGAHTVAWAVGHIAEHESYHLGKCTLLRNLLPSHQRAP
jgi:uncharacterized damage-inducible protein DinB